MDSCSRFSLQQTESNIPVRPYIKTSQYGGPLYCRSRRLRDRSSAKDQEIIFFRKLSPAERHYDIGNRELLAIKLALEEWWHRLEGAAHPFLVLTDPKILEYTRTANRLNPRQARWALFTGFTLSFRPGTKNVKAEALSRMGSVEYWGNATTWESLWHRYWPSRNQKNSQIGPGKIFVAIDVKGYKCICVICVIHMVLLYHILPVVHFVASS